jgi:hypothetical protein
MKYKVVSWVYKTGNHSLAFGDSIIELEPIEDLSDVLEEKDFDIESFNRPAKPTYKVGDKVMVKEMASGGEIPVGEIRTIEKIEYDYQEDLLFLSGNESGRWIYYNKVELVEPTISKMETVESGQESGQSVQDDSWKVTQKEWRESEFDSTIDFCNSKIKPWVMKCRELEARNKLLMYV